MTSLRPAPVPLVVVYALVQSSIASGLDIRSALEGVSRALDPSDPDAASLHATAQRLAVGLGWAEAWEGCGDRLGGLGEALASSWRTGSSPVLALAAAQNAERYATRAAADVAAAALGVRLTLPLALCLLPAFVLVGIVPLLLSIAAGVVAEIAA